MIHNIALALVFGKPLVMYGGIFTLICLIITAVVGVLNFRGIGNIPYKWHPVLAGFVIFVALVHAIFGLSIYFNF